MDQQRLILVVEDDDATRAFLLDNLAADGFGVAGASGMGEGLRAIELRQPSLVVLDLGLEDGSGLALLDRVRAADGLASRIDRDLPVVVLSGRAGDADRVRSFARGADDHLCKPFLYAELLARVRALLRRAEGRSARGVVRVGDLTLDPSTRAVRLAGRRIELAAKEFALLHALAAAPDARVSEAGAVAGRLGLSVAGQHAHARRARLPAAQEAASVGADVGRERAGCRLQADGGRVSWAVGWVGWSLALAALLTLRRRMARLADAEHELRGAATAIALLAELTPPLRLELDRLSAGLADLSELRGAPTPHRGSRGGRLAQVLGNVAANAAEHGVGPVAVRAHREGAVAWLEVANADAAPRGRRWGGRLWPARLRRDGRPRFRRVPARGRGLRIARRAARKLGGRLSVEREDGVTRAVVELPAEEVDGTARRAA